MKRLLGAFTPAAVFVLLLAGVVLSVTVPTSVRSNIILGGGSPPVFKGTAGVFCDTPATSCSFNYTTNAAAKALLIQWADDNPACNSGTAVDDVVSATFDGVAATFLGKRINNISQRLHYVYGILNPHIGTFSVVITIGHSEVFRILVSDYANVSGFGAVVVNSHATNDCSGDTSLTTTLTTTAANSLIYLGVLDSASGLLGNANTIVRGNMNTYIWNFDSGSPIVSPGAYSMNTNVTPATASMSHIAVELKK